MNALGISIDSNEQIYNQVYDNIDRYSANDKYIDRILNQKSDYCPQILR